ncbi:MAG TPA: ferritin family protein [Anaeromyxobacteraceae bacterium]|nr:ferritin family protein [Anaeromyxobacteraceae bacterium]
MGSTFQLFEKAEQLELLCADIYRALARQFQAQPEAHDLFQRLEAEERQHAVRVRLLAARYQHDSKLLEAAAVAAQHLDELLEEARSVLSRVDSGAWGASLEVVKGELAELEERFSAAHAHVIASAANPALRAFFEQLARQDRAHLELLRS